MSAREEILHRIRKATQDINEKDPEKDVQVDWKYAQPTKVFDVLDTFVENIEDYKARIVRTSLNDTGATIVEALRELGAKTVLCPNGLNEDWVRTIEGSGFVIVRDDPPLTNAQLNDTDAVVTAARVAAAETGTICLDHTPDQGRRALTLVPDRHVCVVQAEQVVSDIPEAVARLRPSVDKRQPITWISGGSATSDIELSRVEGVHGPRKLFVILQV